MTFIETPQDLIDLLNANIEQVFFSAFCLFMIVNTYYRIKNMPEYPRNQHENHAHGLDIETIVPGSRLYFDGQKVTVTKIDRFTISFTVDGTNIGYSNIPLYEHQPGYEKTNIERLTIHKPKKHIS